MFASKYFAFLFLLLTLAIFFSLLGNFRTYQSQISIIVLPKSPALCAQSESLVQNFEMLPRTLSFYNRILKDNSEIKDQFAGFSDAAKKEAWNKNLTIKRKGDSQMLEITVHSRNNDAALIAHQTAISLFSLSTQYYNLKTDLDLRIVDGPINSSDIDSWIAPIIISIVLGFILAFFINYILTELNKIFAQPRVSNLFRNIEDKFKFEKNSKLTLEDFGLVDLGKKDVNIEKQPTPEKEPEEKELPKTETFIKRSAVPANLPIAPSNLPINKDAGIPKLGSEKIAKTEETENAEKETKRGEPSEEEIKNRLNKLLKGEL